jgi:excisionase family DNA binding protein
MHLSIPQNTPARAYAGAGSHDVELLTLKEVAAFLRCCVKTVRRIIKKKNIPTIGVGSRIMVPAQHLPLFLTKQW